MTAYPADFRCAQITPYAIAVDMGLLRTQMDGGGARQRRLYKTMPTVYSLEFIMTVQELGAWQIWVNDNAYDYFIIDNLESFRSGLKGQVSSPHSIRFISNLAIDNPVFGWVRVKVQAEGAIAAPEAGWIVGGTPAAPSPLWIIAGTVVAPSPGMIYAGTPATWNL